MSEKLYFASDYQEGAHANILKKLVETNLESTVGYGLDQYSDSARNRIREACACPDAMVEFLVGGTQTNATVIGAILRNYQGVIAADAGHVSSHEAGAIEAGGHKVLTIPAENGKLTAAAVKDYMETFLGDGNRDHLVQPGMVYISQTTESGTIYSLAELTELSQVCHRYALPLYVDGARLAYALGTPSNDVTLQDLARLADVFYIGGTKCGAMFGEAVVVPDRKLIPHFFTTIKQNGALLAKGRMLGIQFDELFKDDLYLNIGKDAIRFADEIREELVANGFELFGASPTNQVFFVVENEKLAALSEKVEYGFWEKYDDAHTVIRFATGWATTAENVAKLKGIIREM